MLPTKLFEWFENRVDPFSPFEETSSTSYWGHLKQEVSPYKRYLPWMMLLSILGMNWGYRLLGYEQAVLPFGIMFSAFAVGFAGFTGWHGGKLVFEYQIGVSSTGRS